MIKSEVFRKLLNLWAIFISIIYYIAPVYKGRMLLLIVCVIIVVVDFMRLHLDGIKEAFILFFGSFLRRHEFTRLSGATYLLLGCLITSLLYSKIIVVASCAFIIVGDTFAALFGQNIKGPRLFKKKTLIGSLGFFLSTLCVILVMYKFTRPFHFNQLLIGAIAATIFEALPLPWNDNFAVPIMTGAVMSLL